MTLYGWWDVKLQELPTPPPSSFCAEHLAAWHILGQTLSVCVLHVRFLFYENYDATHSTLLAKVFLFLFWSLKKKKKRHFFKSFFFLVALSVFCNHWTELAAYEKQNVLTSSILTFQQSVYLLFLRRCRLPGQTTISTHLLKKGASRQGKWGQHENVVLFLRQYAFDTVPSRLGFSVLLVFIYSFSLVLATIRPLRRGNGLQFPS